MLYALTYMSAAVQPFSAADLEALLANCRVKNQSSGLTGLLLYKSNNFIQVLEGEQGVVDATFERISKDVRHRGVLVIASGSIAQRSFPTWAMGYRNLDAQTVPSGYSDFLNTPVTSESFGANPSQAQKLLLLFKQST